ASFRGSSLGAQILDSYSTTVCSTWRSQCFRRVYEKALEGPPPPSSSSSSSIKKSNHSTTSSNPSLNINNENCNHTNSNNNNNSNTKSTLNSRSNLDKNSINLHYSLTTRPHSLSTGAAVIGSMKFDQISNNNTHNNNNLTQNSIQHQHTREQEWHYHLLSMVVDDLITHVRTFPLQIRWIYSELQALYSPNHSNVVVCNLVFLRGLCPVLYSLSSLGKTICSESSFNGSSMHHNYLSGFPNDIFHPPSSFSSSSSSSSAAASLSSSHTNSMNNSSSNSSSFTTTTNSTSTTSTSSHCFYSWSSSSTSSLQLNSGVVNPSTVPSYASE
ncbi:unnamed protein product, partial [Schistosoma turkestanicum]